MEVEKYYDDALALSTFWQRELFHSDVQVNHFLLTTPFPCVTRTYPILYSLLSPTPPRHKYILNGTWRSHRNLPCGLSLQVYTQYPRPEVFTMTSSFSCMRPLLSLPPGLIRHLFRFACFVNSSLRFLIPNLHPICTCSCLFTPLTEGRSARGLTQAAPSQKKRSTT